MNLDNNILKLIESRPELKSKLISNKSYGEVLEILTLKEMDDPKFKQVFTANIWKTYYKNIKQILEIEEWKNPKYQYLLTSSIWNRSYSEVKSILAMTEWDEPKYEHLLTPNIWQSSYKNIRKILEMKEWDDPQFVHLFTSSIWNNTYEQIASKLRIPYFQMPQYRHLLTPSIFLITEQNINDNINLFKDLGLERFIETTNIRINARDQKLLIKYMINNDIPLVVRGRLHEILRTPSNSKLQKYGITWELVREEEQHHVKQKVKQYN